MNRKLKIALCLIGIFIAGGATGAFVTLRVVRKAGSERSPMDAFVPRQMERLTQELDLSEEQKVKVGEILKQAADEMRVIRRESIQSTSVKVRELNAAISAVLTPEQAKRFEEMMQKQRERMRRFQQERSDGRRPGPDGSRERPPEGP